MPGHEYRTALTDGAGNLTLPFHPDSVGACSLTATAFNARPWRRSLVVVAGAPAALQAMAPLVLDDTLADRQGDGDGQPEAGEQVELVVTVRNAGGSGAATVTGTLGTSDPWITMVKPAATYGAIAAGATSPPDIGFRIMIARDCPDQKEVAFTLQFVGAGGLLQPQHIRLLVRSPELVPVAHTESEQADNDDGRPQPGETVQYTFLVCNMGTVDAHALIGRLRNHDGLAGYHVHHGISPAGPFAKVTPLPLGQTSSWTDANLAPLTRYFYVASAVDSSGDESSPGIPISARTDPGDHGGSPTFTRESSQTPVTLAPSTAAGTDILVGRNVLHLFHADGSAPVDADGSSAIPGDFTTLGRWYQAGGSLADLDGDGGRDVLGATLTSKQLLAFDGLGVLRPGFPVPLPDPIWSSVAVADLNGDGFTDIVVASTDGRVYVFDRNGAQLPPGRLLRATRRSRVTPPCRARWWPISTATA